MPSRTSKRNGQRPISAVQRIILWVRAEVGFRLRSRSIGVAKCPWRIMPAHLRRDPRHMIPILFIANRTGPLHRETMIAAVLFLVLAGLVACVENPEASPTLASVSLPEATSPMSPTTPSAPTPDPRPSRLPVNAPDPTASVQTTLPAPSFTATPAPTPTAPPMKGESQENLWELEARFAGFVSPVVVDGIVYAGTENRMNALDAQSGEALWSFETAETF